MARLSIVGLLSLWIIACTAKRGGGGGGSSSENTELNNPSCEKFNDVRNSSLEGVVWTKVGDTEALIIDGNDSTRNVLSNANTGINSRFDKYDAYYYGSMAIAISPPTTGNQSNCGRITTTITDAYLRIGPQTRGDMTRKAYDSNPFYLEFGRWGSCLGSVDVSFTSSNDAFTNGKVWSLASTIAQNGTEMSFTGNLTSTQANLGNFFNVRALSTSLKCPDDFFLRSMIQYNRVSLEGTVSRSNAVLDFRIASGAVPTRPGNGSGLLPPIWPEGWVAGGSFRGSSWEKGGFLVLKDGTVMTDGSGGTKPRSVKTIIIAVCVGVAALLALLLCCWFCCCRRRRRGQKKTEYDGPTTS